MKMNVGILGTGEMAGEMAEALKKMGNFVPYAVASRTKERARQFAYEHGIPKYFGSYEELLNDKKTELIYIATPHAMHYENALLCIRHHKPVLCEKSFTLNKEQAVSLFREAETAGVFIAEAIWTRYLPLTPQIREIVAQGRIGTVKGIQASLSYPVSSHERVTSPELGGGALLDLGIYVLTFLSMVLGDRISEIHAAANLSSEGIDLDNSISLKIQPDFQKEEVLCSVYSSVTTCADRWKHIYGTEGYIITGLENGNDEFVEIYDKNHQLTERIFRPENKETDFVYEFEACRRAIESGKTECKEMTHKETIIMMSLMDQIRDIIGVRYDKEHIN